MRREFMKRFWKYVTGIVPAYGLFPLVFSFVFNCLVYSGSRAIAGGWYHHNIESNLDLRLPFVPQFLIIYFGCYVFWAVNYILAARQEREQVYRFFTADIISRCVCLIIFLAYPSLTFTIWPFFPRAFTSSSKITFILRAPPDIPYL